jgi:hypothetical protein
MAGIGRWLSNLPQQWLMTYSLFAKSFQIDAASCYFHSPHRDHFKRSELPAVQGINHFAVQT